MTSNILLFILFVICIYFLINLMMNTNRMFVTSPKDSLLNMLLFSSNSKEEDLNIASLEENVSGGEGFDRYDDEKLYLLNRNININDREIVIDGNNLLFYLKKLDSDKHDYEYYLDKAIKFCDRFNSDVYFVIKLSNKEKISMEKKIKNKNLTIIISKGSTKSRDDYAVVNVCSKLKNPLVLTRDRYRDITQTVLEKPDSYEIYGKNKNIMKENNESYNILGKWTFNDYMAGFSYNESHQGLYEILPAKNLYNYVYLFN